MFENNTQVSVEKNNHIPHTYEENENLTKPELLQIYLVRANIPILFEKNYSSHLEYLKIQSFP